MVVRGRLWMRVAAAASLLSDCLGSQAIWAPQIHHLAVVSESVGLFRRLCRHGKMVGGVRMPSKCCSTVV